jgi:DNA-binding NarL/FixJ family response regulator
METSAWPEPAPSELATLTLHVTEWGQRTRAQQSICLAILRGHCSVPEIARYLHLGQRTVEEEVSGLIGQGLLWDSHRLMIH